LLLNLKFELKMVLPTELSLEQEKILHNILDDEISELRDPE
jgi:hypothetical protein